MYDRAMLAVHEHDATTWEEDVCGAVLAVSVLTLVVCCCCSFESMRACYNGSVLH